MKTRALVVVLLLSLGAVAAYSQCSFNVNIIGADHFAVAPGQKYTVSWSPIPGTFKYRLTETTTGYLTANQAAYAIPPAAEGQTGDFFEIGYTTSHFASEDRYFGYSLTAFAPGGVEVLCATNFAVLIRPDAATKAAFRRAIVPVAGSLTAADGSKFHTSLRLVITGNIGSPLNGRIIFHPQGVPASDNDPSIAYHLEVTPGQGLPGTGQYWDDVVAAMGASGLGSLDIVPEGNIAGGNDGVPVLEARVWNDIHGTVNGATVPAFRASDLFMPFSRQYRNFTVWTDGGKSRMNVGFRTTGSDPVTVTVLAQGLVRIIVLPGNSFTQMPIAQLLGITPQDGQQVQLAFNNDFPNRNSAAYVYYTITENTSNDPRVFLPQLNSDVPLFFNGVAY
jgi:hypothetical protein